MFLGKMVKVTGVFLSVCRISISFNADPDPASKDLNEDPDPGSQANAYSSCQTLPSQKIGF
jgi:hypothetical protein